MLSSRIAASVAIIFGGGVGALGAVLASRTEQPGAQPTAGIAERQSEGKSIGPPDASIRVPAPSASPAPVPRALEAESLGGPSRSRTTSTSETRRVGPPDAVAALFEPIVTAEERSRAEVECANGEGGACQKLALTYEAEAHDRASTAQAARYQRLAVGMLVRACRGSEAQACYALAEMHATGRGMKQSETHARALIERAEMLCRINKRQPVCAGLLPATAAPDNDN